jgi:PTH1 family peptidyl-tRNA hydrolase
VVLGRKRPGAEPRRGTPFDLLVVGLGNPGKDLAGSRHNAGADAVELVAKRHGERLKPSKDAPALVAEVRVADKRLALAFPTTYMNDSGRGAAPLVRRYGIEDPSHIVVIHDELDIEPGRMKIKLGGGLAGHNGLKSLVAHLHTQDFVRIRIGVGKPPGGAERGIDHVLTRPSKREAELIGICVELAADATEMIATDGVDAAMARYNAR